MQTVLMDEKTQTALLHTLNEIPPIIWLNHAQPDQVEHWKKTKLFATRLRDELKAYFSGYPSENQDEYIELCKNYYLALYAVLQYAWKNIKIEAEKYGVEIPDSPGECLIEELENKVESLFEMCLDDYKEYSIRKAYKLYQLNTKVQRLTSKPVSDWSQKEKENYASFMKESKRNLNRVTPTLAIVCFLSCERMKQKDKILKGKLNNFWRAQKDLESFLAGRFHPSHKLGSYAWKSGTRLKGQKNGTYA